MVIGVVALAVALLFLAGALFAPQAGLVSFVVLLFLRPNDLVSALAAIPFVKIALLVTLVSLFVHGSGYRRMFLQFPQVKALLVFLLAMLASVPFSYWRGGSFKTTTDFLKVILVYFLIINALTSPRALSQFLWAMLLCASALSVSAVRRYLTGDLDLAGLRIAGMVGGSFEDPNDLALSLVMLIPIAYFMSVNAVSWSKKFLLLSILSTLALGVVATQSRGGFLGLGIVLLLIFKQSTHKLATIALLGAVLLLVVFLAPEGSFARISSIMDYQEDESAIGRLTAWKAGMQMFADYPLFGVGAGVFEVAYGKAYKPEGAHNKWIAPHSSFVQVLAELGAFGMICFLVLIVVTLKHLRLSRQLAEDAEIPVSLVNLNKGITVGIWGFLVCAAFLSQAYAWLFNIAIALSIAVNRQIAEQVELAQCPSSTPY